MKKNEWYYFFKFLFDIDLYPYQMDMVKAILQEKKKRVIILAATRAGKSYAISMIAIVYALLNSDKKIFIIAPTYKQASIIMEYIYSFITKSDYVLSQTILTISKRDLKLGKRMTFDTVTFKNNSTIRILSAEGKGERLYGFGGHFIVCLDYDTEVYTEEGIKKIGELVENKEKIKVLSYNLNSSRIEYKYITNWYKKEYDEYYEIELENGVKVKISGNHPVYVRNKGWVRVEDLKEGDEVLFLG